MPRKPRVEVPGGTFHITARGVDEAVVFESVAERNLYRRLLEQVVIHYGWTLVGFCQMGTHVHLIVRTPEPTLARGMQYLSGQFARLTNKERDRRGHLFGGRYRSTLIETDSHLLEACRYVVLNPVRAGLCDRPDEWRWSSYLATAGVVRAPWFLSVGEVLGLFSPVRKEAEAAWVAFVDEGLERDALRTAAA